MSIKKRFLNFFGSYKFNGVLFKNFIKIFTVIMLIFTIVLIMTYKSTSEVAVGEFTSLNENYVNNAANMYDVLIDEVKYITSNMAVDSDTIMYAMQSDSNIKNGLTIDRLGEKIKAYESSIKSINSIYVYSEDFSRVCTGTGNVKLSNFSDMNWREEYLKTERGKMRIFARKINGVYPKVVSFMYRMNTYDYNAAVIVNMDVVELGNIVNMMGENNLTDTYIIDENMNIIYSKNKEDFGVPVYGILEKIYSEESKIIIDEGESYIGKTKESKKTGWVYVAVTKLDNYTEKMKKINVMMAMIIFLMIVSCFVISFVLAKNTYQPIVTIVDVLKNKNNIKSHNFRNDEIKDIVSGIMLIVNDNNELKKELQNSMDMNEKLKLTMLQAQINPHFINNTLNMINVESIRENGRQNLLSESIAKLTKILKYSYINENSVVTLKEELDFSENYMNLMIKRYGNLEVIWDIDKTLYNIKFVRLCLQPILENAVYHGICPRQQKGTIKIIVQGNEESAFIEIIDDGIGMTEERLGKIQNALHDENASYNSIGIVNVSKRLKLIFGSNAEIIINSMLGVGTSVILKIPIITLQ